MSVYTNPAAASAEHAAAYIAALLELVGSQDPLGVLRSTPAAVRGGIQGLTGGQLVRREQKGKWSMRHVIQHLADSELVFGWRLRMVLAHDRPRLQGFDQDLWAERLGYDEADVMQALNEFAVFRGSNLRLLERTSATDLQRCGVHEERGEESVAHLMRLYAGHDLLHLRQLARIRAAVG